MEKQHCSKKVYNSNSAWDRGHSCSRAAWKDGFCKQHHPDSVKARQEEADARYEEKRKSNPYVQLQEAKKRIEELKAELELQKRGWEARSDKQRERIAGLEAEIKAPINALRIRVQECLEIAWEEKNFRNAGDTFGDLCRLGSEVKKIKTAAFSVMNLIGCHKDKDWQERRPEIYKKIINGDAYEWMIISEVFPESTKLKP